MPSVEIIWGQLVQYGLLGVVLFFLGLFSYRGGRWLGDRILLPIAQGHINFLSETTNTMKKLGGDLQGLSQCERELHAEVQCINSRHTDPDGPCSTVHTNNGLQIIMQALVQLAQRHNVELDELQQELKAIVARQKRQP